MLDLVPVYMELRQIMLPYAAQLHCTSDANGFFSLATKHMLKSKQPLWFGGVRMNKSYVSYHLMPVYVNPQLLAGISPGLKRRMQGKSCFNFKVVDTELFEELARLTAAGFEDYKRMGYV